MNIKAFIYMLISAFSFALMNVIVKYLTHFSALQMVFFRCIVALTICISILKVRNISLWGNDKMILISRGLVGTLSLSAFFISLKLMPVGTAVSLRYLAPFFGIALAVKFLNEKIRALQWVYIFIAFIGAILIKGFDSRITTFALIAVLTSAFSSGVVYMILRKIGRTENPVVVVFYFMWIASLISLIISLFNWTPLSNSDIVPILSIGVLGYMGQYFMTLAFQIEDANKVAPLKYVEAVVAILLAWVWLGETYDPITLLGIGLVVTGVLLNSITR